MCKYSLGKRSCGHRFAVVANECNLAIRFNTGQDTNPIICCAKDPFTVTCQPGNLASGSVIGVIASPNDGDCWICNPSPKVNKALRERHFTSDEILHYCDIANNMLLSLNSLYRRIGVTYHTHVSSRFRGDSPNFPISATVSHQQFTNIGLKSDDACLKALNEAECMIWSTRIWAHRSDLGLALLNNLFNRSLNSLVCDLHKLSKEVTQLVMCSASYDLLFHCKITPSYIGSSTEYLDSFYRWLQTLPETEEALRNGETLLCVAARMSKIVDGKDSIAAPVLKAIPMPKRQT